MIRALPLFVKSEGALSRILFGTTVDPSPGCAWLWGQPARAIVAAIANGVEDATPVRFVHVGGASGEESIDLPGAGLRSSPIVLMGSGAKSVPQTALLNAVRNIFDVVGPAHLRIATKAVHLSDVESYWNAPGKPRVVFTLG